MRQLMELDDEQQWLEELADYLSMQFAIRRPPACS
jgi:hypothetical protein